jgi:hypothetical protein
VNYLPLFYFQGLVPECEEAGWNVNLQLAMHCASNSIFNNGPRDLLSLLLVLLSFLFPHLTQFTALFNALDFYVRFLLCLLTLLPELLL